MLGNITDALVQTKGVAPNCTSGHHIFHCHKPAIQNLKNEQKASFTL